MYTVYLAINRINSKKYVGLTSKQVRHRWLCHISKANSGSPYAFHRAIRKYGTESFSIDSIDFADTLPKANEKEIFWIDYYKSWNRDFGYNSTYGGISGVITKETGLKISIALKGRKHKKSSTALISKKSKRYWDSLSVLERLSLTARQRKGRELRKQSIKPFIEKLIYLQDLWKLHDRKLAIFLNVTLSTIRRFRRGILPNKYDIHERIISFVNKYYNDPVSVKT